MWILFILAGIAGGILGGMGMGGGTLLIPILTIFFGLEQHLAQGLNLLSFLPMAIASIIMHLKNKLIDYKGILYIIIPAVIMSVGGSFLAKAISGKVLSKIFGGFLILLAIFQFITAIRKKEN